MTTAKRLSDKEYDFIFTRVPRLCVDLVIRDQRGVVLSRRDIPPYKGMWHLPGGRVLIGESVLKAVHRVARGETNFFVSDPNLIGTLEYHFPMNKGRQHSVSIVYSVKPLRGKLMGDRNARQIKFFKRVPPRTIPAVRDFLIRGKLVAG